MGETRPKELDTAREAASLECTTGGELGVPGLQNIVQELRAKDAHLRVMADLVIDTGTAEGEHFLRWLDVFSKFEVSATRERQREGVHVAKVKGAYKGRPRTINADAILRLRDEGLGPSEIAKRLKISRASVYRLASTRQLPDLVEGSGPRHFAARVARGLSGVLGRTNLRRKAK